jgi:hypothetical protein
MLPHYPISTNSNLFSHQVSQSRRLPPSPSPHCERANISQARTIHTFRSSHCGLSGGLESEVNKTMNQIIIFRLVVRLVSRCQTTPSNTTMGASTPCHRQSWWSCLRPSSLSSQCSGPAAKCHPLTLLHCESPLNSSFPP